MQTNVKYDKMRLNRVITGMTYLSKLSLLNSRTMNPTHEVWV